MSNSLDQQGFKIYDSAGSVGVWIDTNGAGTAPAWALACTRQLKVSVTTDDLIGTVGTAVYNALDGDAAFVGVSDDTAGTIVVRDVATGVRTNASDEGALFTITTTVEGVASVLHEKYFVLEDTAGTVGVWFDVDNAGGSAPAGATGCDRQIEVTTITSGMTIGQVGTALYTKLDSDAQYVGVSDDTAGTIVLEDVAYGVRGAAGSGNTTFILTEIVSGHGSSLDGKYFVLQDEAGSVAFWFDVDDSGTAEPVHGADRAVEITTIATADPIGTVGTAVYTAIVADSKFDAGSDNAAGTIQVTSSTFGAKSAASAGDSGFTVSEAVAGHDSNLDGKYFTLQDSAGTVAFWFDVDDSGTVEPSHGADRSVEITTVASADAIGSVVSKVNTAIDGDAQFVSVSAVSPNVIVEDLKTGVRAAASEGDSGFTVTESVAGVASALNGKYFRLADVDGTVGFWIDVDNAGTAAPVHGADRAVEITAISSCDDAPTVAGKLRTAIDTDGKFDVGTLASATFTAVCKDLKSVTDFNAGTSGFTMSVTTQGADSGAGPTGAIWTAIASGKKVLVDISACTDAPSVAAAVESAFDALTGATTKMATTTSSGDIAFTRELPAVVADDVPKNTDDTGVGSITSVVTNTGIASIFTPSADTITKATHGFTTGLKVALTINSGSPPTGTSATNYWAIVDNANTFRLATSYANAVAGTDVDFSDYGDENKTVTFTPATLSVACKLQKSVDEVNWADVTTASTLTASGTTMVSMASVAYPYVRAVVTPASGICDVDVKLAGTTYLY